MRGPSSSHTAGAYHIALMARDLLGAAPRRAEFAFDPGGSYGRTYQNKGADRAFAMGLMGKPLTDGSFFTALADAAASGLEISFRGPAPSVSRSPECVEIRLSAADDGVLGRSRGALPRRGRGRHHERRRPGRSISTGRLTRFLIEAHPRRRGRRYGAILDEDGRTPRRARKEPSRRTPSGSRHSPPPHSALSGSGRYRPFSTLTGVLSLRQCSPVYFVAKGPALFSSAEGDDPARRRTKASRSASGL